MGVEDDSKYIRRLRKEVTARFGEHPNFKHITTIFNAGTGKWNFQLVGENEEYFKIAVQFDVSFILEDDVKNAVLQWKLFLDGLGRRPRNGD